MPRKTILERVKPEIKEYIINLAKLEAQWYARYVKNGIVICEDKEIYSEEVYRKENYIKHPHDKAIKNILSNKQEAAILINEVLELKEREEIKPEQIAEYKTDFITKDYFNREIDIIYKDLTQKNVFYLIEHQSKVDYRMPMRLIEYYNEVMKNTYKNREPNKKYEIPVVIPIVVYSGEGKWNAKTSLRKEVLPIRGILPLDLGSYKVFDVNNYTDDELIAKPGILTKVLSLENTKNIEEIEEKTNKIAECKLNEKERSYLNQYIIYFIGNKYGENEKDKILNKINKNVEEEKSMLSDVLDQIEARGEARGKARGEKIGEARGEKIGIIKGEKKSRSAIVLNMLKNNYSDKEIKKIIEITDSELKDIKNHVNDGGND